VSRVLVLGGYGVFGSRIATRLVAAGHEVLVAGRSADKAQRFCAGRPGFVPLALDRARIAEELGALAPDLLVDATGPFQEMDYAVPRACIAAGVHYCDIADGRAFVCGIAALDADARAAGVAVVSGASSLPALSGAVVRALAEGMSRVRSVEMALSASNRATAGPAVAAGIIRQAGQSIAFWQAGGWRRGFGWQHLKRARYAVPGKPPIEGRLVSLVDVPDMTLLPARLPGAPSVVMRAGAELAVENLALWLASWPIRWGLFRNSAWLISLVPAWRKLVGEVGSDCSAMKVTLVGERAGQRLEKRWTLIATQGAGPDIPALAVPPIVERILSGSEPAGARDAGPLLALSDYDAAFAPMSVEYAVEASASPSLYQRVMGATFDALPAPVQRMHLLVHDGPAIGEAIVTGASNALGRLIARILGFPSGGTNPLRVTMDECGEGETWTRDFGGRRFASRLSQRGNQLVERFGPLRFRFDLPGGPEGLRMVMRGWSAFGIPLPLALAPRSEAREWAEGARFHFDVPIELPLVGRVVHYRGWLELAA
jgi:NAD(P)-dependent dehydrogenase (short-subunit alcohol dehydrogenase family)